MRIFLAVTGCFLTATAAGAADLYGEPAPDPIPNEIVEKRWSFVVAPYLMAPTITGEAGTGWLPSTKFDVSPSTIFDDLKFGGMGHLEAVYDNRFSAVLDVAYMDLGRDVTFPAVGGSVSASFKQTIGELMFGYRFYRTPQAWAEAYAGGRVWYNEVGVTASVPGNSFRTDLTEAWIDPVIGLRGQVHLSDKWSLYGSGNVGGFDFGFASDFTWGLQGGVGYHFNDHVALNLQYKAIGVDFNNNKQGVDRFTYDTITHGPLMGVAISF